MEKLATEVEAPPPPQSNEDNHKFGCDHYKRRCKIRAPCCNQVFSCRLCHNEATSSLSDPKGRHEIVRHDIKQVICLLCDTEQEVAQVCSNCGVKMGEYFCGICNFYDDDISKGQFHCDDCGICRVGGQDNYFHCKKCGACYVVNLCGNHSCLENSMKNDCPVCCEYLFDSVEVSRVMQCGHTIHHTCFLRMIQENQYRCPVCSKTLFDMSDQWRMLDSEIEAVEMPEEYNYEVSILCNDCNSTSKVRFHILGHKCGQCNSYNTRRVSSPEQE